MHSVVGACPKNQESGVVASESDKSSCPYGVVADTPRNNYGQQRQDTQWYHELCI